jgi:hypothetical protein
MSEQISGKLPIDKPQEHANPIAERAAVVRLGATAADVYTVMAEAADSLTAIRDSIHAIAERLRPLVPPEEVTGDDDSEA